MTDALAIDEAFYPETPAGRPLWLITLADLSLLLVGFFVLLQAQPGLDRKALARGLADGFRAGAPMPQPEAMPVEAHLLDGFAAGSAQPDDTAALTDWARAAARDPRVAFSISGATDGTDADVDPATGSATVLAADRARAAMVAMVAAGVPVTRSSITIAPRSHRRDVVVTLAFVGEEGRKP